MAKILIQVEVAYPKEFRVALAGQADVMKAAGGRVIVFSGVDADRHNDVTVCMEWESVSSAQQFWRSAGAQQMKKAWRAVRSQITVLRERPDD